MDNYTETVDDVREDDDVDTSVNDGKSVDEEKDCVQASPRSGDDGIYEHPFKHSNDTSDLRLIVEGRPLYVSKVVLSLVSPVLKRMFAKRQENNVELKLPDKRYDDIVKFLMCIYPDILAPITGENAEVILNLADEYQVKRLVDKCEEFLIDDIKQLSCKSHPDKIVHYLNVSDKYGLDSLQKATFEAAAKTESDLLENVHDFWELPSVTTTSVFIRRLKLLESYGKNIRSKIKEVQNHCSLYHKGDTRPEGSVCTKCYANIGKHTQAELKLI